MATITVSSFFSLMLLAIQERIKVEVPEINWVDQDFGQLEDYEERPPVAWPCLLVDFGSTKYDMLHGQVQWAESTIQFKLGLDPFSATHSAVPIDNRQAAMEFWELEQKVYKVLQAWDGNGMCQPLTRVLGVTEPREDKFRVRLMQFTTVFEDDSAAPVYQKVPQPPVQVEFI